jgi:hypothetical protein
VLNAIPATAGSVSTSYLVDGSVTQAKLATGVAGNGPAFSAYNSASQSLTGPGFNYITFDTEDFDTNNNFASSTFTPTVAGYYQLSSAVRTNGAPGNEYSIFLFKGSSNIKMGTTLNQTGGIASSAISVLVYANGSTDAFRIGFYVGANCSTAGNSIYTWFTGSLVRAA